MTAEELTAALAAAAGADALADPDDRRYWRDATESQGVEARPDAVVRPADAEAVARVVSWCYANGVAIVPRGGGTGFAGGCVAETGGVVVDLSRMTRVRAIDPGQWRMHVEAGLRTSEVRRIAREHGLMFPPDPGAAEQSQIGGNVATNAGGPHAFKYGVTGAWVTGLEVVLPPGDLVTVGGPLRKDVAAYDLVGLLTGSEGTLGIVTAAWLRLLPAVEATAVVAAAHPGPREGCAAIDALLATGLVPAAVEYLDGGALGAARGSYPFELPDDAGFLVVAEVDGTADEVAAALPEAEAALGDGAVAVAALGERAEVAALWRWREGVSHAVEAVHGGKVSEDVAVPLDRLAEAIEATAAIGARHGLDTCSWGHAGDGNLHSTFMIDPRDGGQLDRARSAAHDLFAAATALGGSISGEHGIGIAKRGQLGLQLDPAALALHAGIKRLIDPKGLMNPGKKV
ncbi:MAG: FAD-binding protein [Solirubrobacterales bacterium]|nr:FAD-binding protein [Solirubrobacterales bacterium]